MFREMRRKTQQLPQEECEAVLRRGAYGVLAVRGDEGWPYAVPVSYVYSGEKIYFHCALAGHKLDAIKGEERVSFCVVDENEPHPETFTTWYRSVIAFGRARILTDAAAKRAAFEAFAAKYSPDDEPGRLEEIDKLFDRADIVEISIERLTGKEARELVQRRKENE